jgi:S1-C subfamily serine protease
MYDKRKLEAELIGSDPTTDLALLKVDTRGLKPVLYGDSDKVEVGQWVLAVGNPFNLSSTVTAGIVSAKARNINILRGSYSIESFIQTDAVVNPGNSGGALVNEKGELIGINTAIISESGGYEGYSFAIPANLVRKVVRDIREFGEVQRAILGVGIAEVTGEIAQQQALPGVAGVYINSVSQGSSAAEAGIREGDVIITINNVKTNSVPELQEQIALFRPGDKISLEFYRQGQKFRRDNVVLQSLSEAGSR